MQVECYVGFLDNKKTGDKSVRIEYYLTYIVVERIIAASRSERQDLMPAQKCKRASPRQLMLCQVFNYDKKGRGQEKHKEG